MQDQSFTEWAEQHLNSALEEATSPGDFIAILGGSGTGKTTFANKAARDLGGVVIDCLQPTWRAELTAARNRNVPLVFFDEAAAPDPDGADLRRAVKQLTHAAVRVVLLVNRNSWHRPEDLLTPFVTEGVEPARAIIVDFDGGVSLLQRDMSRLDAPAGMAH